MKIIVTGSCQATVVARCLEVMAPGVQVQALAHDADPLAGPDDIVLRQEIPGHTFPRAERAVNEIQWPFIHFNAFHPDLIYVNGPAGDVQTPLLQYNSSLVMYGWQRDFSEAQTARLFAEPIFEQLNFFNVWGSARRTLLAESDAVGFSVEAMLHRWTRMGCFMHSLNHPKLFAIADVARELAQRAGIEIAFASPEDVLQDPSLEGALWPVYPEIASRLGLTGSYAFKAAGSAATPILLTLDEFIAGSYEAYAKFPKNALYAHRFAYPAYRNLDVAAVLSNARSAPADPPEHTAQRARTSSPYNGLPDVRFWRRAVETLAPSEVDPVEARFTIDRHDRIATAGSCFAQHISHALARSGYMFYVAEQAPRSLSARAAASANYGAFSARYGNIYTARALLQLFDRAYGTFVPREEPWLRPDGRYADPFRPEIEPDGFASPDDVVASRAEHLDAVRTMFERLDVFVFTLGLTEAWRSKRDGAVFPLAPGVTAGRIDDDEYEFVNFTTAEITADLTAFLERLAGVNPRARVVLTVSPVPLIATYEPRHVLVSTTASKAVLRAAADEIERTHPNVWYFPSYEIITGSFNAGRYFEPDLRSVTAEGVDHVMRLFFKHADPTAIRSTEAEEDALLQDAVVICDEERIAEAS